MLYEKIILQSAGSLSVAVLALFMLYGAIASVNVIIVRIKNRRTSLKHRITYLIGAGFWVLLGIHDGLAAMGLPRLYRESPALSSQQKSGSCWKTQGEQGYN